MHTLEVGGLYAPGRTRWPQTEQVRLGRNVTELMRSWPGATSAEVEAHQHGDAEFALVDETPDLLVLAYRFGNLDWSDTPFQAHRMSAEEPGWPVGGSEDGILLRTVLVDGRDGRVLALRHDALPVNFANAVRVAVAEQLIHPLDDQAAGRRLDALYDQYPTTADMVARRARARCQVQARSGPTAVHFY